MGVNVRVDGLMVVAVVGIVIAGVIYFNRKAISQAVSNAADEAAAKVNPFDERNIANSSVNSIGEYFTGQTGWTLGGAIYDWTH